VIGYTFRPIEQWPRQFTNVRKTSPFSATYSVTLEVLQKELRQVGASNIVIQLALSAGDIRRDGLPRADARPEHPGVILSFESKGRSFSMPCDQYTKWTENLRAIALSLEALRKVDRYGVTQSGEQYKGWEALPAASNNPRVLAADFLVAHGFEERDAILKDPEVRQRAYRKAARTLHPDVAGGSNELFAMLKRSYDLLCEPESEG
jgi:hypothetical protein